MAVQHDAPFLAEDVRWARRRSCLLLHPDKDVPGASGAERQILLDHTHIVNRAADDQLHAVELPQLDVVPGAGTSCAQQQVCHDGERRQHAAPLRPRHARRRGGDLEICADSAGKGDGSAGFGGALSPRAATAQVAAAVA